MDTDTTLEEEEEKMTGIRTCEEIARAVGPAIERITAARHELDAASWDVCRLLTECKIEAEYWQGLYACAQKQLDKYMEQSAKAWKDLAYVPPVDDDSCTTPILNTKVS